MSVEDPKIRYPFCVCYPIPFVQNDLNFNSFSSAFHCWFDLVRRELKATLIQQSKDYAALEAQNKAITAELNELKTQLSGARTEVSGTKLQLQSKIAEFTAKIDSQSKEISILEVQDRKR